MTVYSNEKKKIILCFCYVDLLRENRIYICFILLYDLGIHIIAHTINENSLGPYDFNL